MVFEATVIVGDGKCGGTSACCANCSITHRLLLRRATARLRTGDICCLGGGPASDWRAIGGCSNDRLSYAICAVSGRRLRAGGGAWTVRRQTHGPAICGGLGSVTGSCRPAAGRRQSVIYSAIPNGGSGDDDGRHSVCHRDMMVVPSRCLKRRGGSGGGRSCRGGRVGFGGARTKSAVRTRRVHDDHRPDDVKGGHVILEKTRPPCRS